VGEVGWGWHTRVHRTVLLLVEFNVLTTDLMH